MAVLAVNVAAVTQYESIVSRRCSVLLCAESRVSHYSVRVDATSSTCSTAPDSVPRVELCSMAAVCSVAVLLVVQLQLGCLHPLCPHRPSTHLSRLWLLLCELAYHGVSDLVVECTAAVCVALLAAVDACHVTVWPSLPAVRLKEAATSRALCGLGGDMRGRPLPLNTITQSQLCSRSIHQRTENIWCTRLSFELTFSPL